MPAPLSRIGRALLKFFKPLRVTPPHLLGHRDSGSGASGFQLLKFKQPSKEAAPKLDEAVLADLAKTQASQEPELPPLPDKPPAHWLDLVVHLLATCRRASDKMKNRAGINSYQRSLMAKGNAKLRTVGNIINTSTEEIEKKQTG